MYRKERVLETISIPDCGSKCEIKKFVSLFSSMTISSDADLYHVSLSAFTCV